MLDSAPALPAVEAADRTAPATMADVIDLIRNDTALTPARRRNLASSIRRFCSALGYAPEAAEASFTFFRNRLEHFHPLEAGIQKKRWQTIKSDVGFALDHVGIPRVARRERLPLSPDWQELRNQGTADRVPWVLSRLSRFCSERGIEPQHVNDAVISDFIAYIRTCSFKTSPERQHRTLCLEWNRLAEGRAALRLQPVALPSYRDLYTRPWDELPSAFTAEADGWLKTMSEEVDLLSEEGPIKPLRPASIESYRYALRQIVAAMVAKGHDLDRIDGLSCLVEPEAAKAALSFFLDRNEGEPNTTTANIAHVLVLVVETAVHADPEVIATLKRFRTRLSKRKPGLSPRPKEALRPFTDPAKVEKILMLPQKILKRMKRKATWTLKDARLMQVAVALELLLMRPIRRKNLVALRLGEHVIRTGDRISIVVQADDVKNEYELDYPIPAESAALLDFYVAHLLPLFGPNPMGFVFPGDRPERTKSPAHFGRMFKKLIREETGLQLYLHVMRHFAATLYLRENPGAYETIRRVLAHKSLSTTTRSYVNLEDEAAVRQFDDLVLKIRDAICGTIRHA